jgi:hypothetical protein
LTGEDRVAGKLSRVDGKNYRTHFADKTVDDRRGSPFFVNRNGVIGQEFDKVVSQKVRSFNSRKGEQGNHHSRPVSKVSSKSDGRNSKENDRKLAQTTQKDSGDERSQKTYQSKHQRARSMISQIESNFDKILGPGDDDAQYNSPNLVQDKKKSSAIPQTTKNKASPLEHTPNFPKTHKSNPKIDSTRHSNPQTRATRPKKRMFYDDSTDNSRSVSLSRNFPNPETPNSHPDPQPSPSRSSITSRHPKYPKPSQRSHSQKSPKSSPKINPKSPQRPRRASEKKSKKEISKSKYNLLLNKF